MNMTHTGGRPTKVAYLRVLDGGSDGRPPASTPPAAVRDGNAALEVFRKIQEIHNFGASLIVAAHELHEALL